MTEILMARLDDINLDFTQIEGDVTFAGVAPNFVSTIGAGRVHLTMLNADVFSSDITWTGNESFSAIYLNNQPPLPAQLLTIGAESNYDFYDDFRGPANQPLDNQTPLISATSSKWIATGGAGSTLYAGAGNMGNTATGTSYGVMQLTDTPWEVGGVFESVGTWNTPVIAVLKDYAGSGFNYMWHSQIDQDGFNISYWNDPDVNVQPQWVLPPAMESYTLATDTKYRIRITFNPPWVDYVIQDFLTGTVIATYRAFDPNVVNVIGPWVFFEVTDTPTIWHEAYVRLRPNEPTLRFGQFFDGINATPIGQSIPHAGNFSALVVGLPTEKPQGIFTVNYSGNAGEGPIIQNWNTGESEFTIAATQTGFGASLYLMNGQGAFAQLEFGGDYGWHFFSNNGDEWLTKPFNDTTPFFANALGFGGSGNTSPGLINSGTTLQVILADDSGLTGLEALTFNKITLTEPATGSTLTIDDGKTVRFSNTFRFSGTDSTTFTLPTANDTIVGIAATQTLTNKTISGASNTLSNIANTSLTNSSITIAGHAVSLGGTQALAASDLSNGVSGSGSIVLATSPTLTTPHFASIINTGTLTLPTSTDTLVGRATTDTLTNKTLTSPIINVTGLIKGNGASAVSAATAGSDYLAPPSGTAILKANSGGALANATAGTDYMQPGTTSTVTAGFTLTPYNGGTISSGTYTPAAANGNYQYITNNGAFTLAAPAADSAVDILVTNGASAGTITISGYTYNVNNFGDALNTTSGNKFIISVRRINSISTLSVKALQ